LMLSGIIEFSVIMFTQAVLESSTNVSARLGKTGYTAAGSSRSDQILASAQSRAKGFLDPKKFKITTEVYSSFGNIGKPEPCIKPTTPPCPGKPTVNFQDINGNGTWDSDMGAAGLGNAGDIVVYTLTYPWPLMTPLVSAVIGDTYTITARTVVKNEPYDH
jgi:hypothetical protein